MTPLTMTPVGANGETAPAWAPLPSMSALRKGGTPACAPTAMPIGASSAAVAMLPGPIEESTSATTKNITGMMPALPRQTATARAARRCSVPFTLAMPKSSVTPARVMKSGTGNAPMTSAYFMPPR
jgi:hypothetical protein